MRGPVGIDSESEDERVDVRCEMRLDAIAFSGRVRHQKRFGAAAFGQVARAHKYIDSVRCGEE